MRRCERSRMSSWRSGTASGALLPHHAALITASSASALLDESVHLVVRTAASVVTSSEFLWLLPDGAMYREQVRGGCSGGCEGGGAGSHQSTAGSGRGRAAPLLAPHLLRPPRQGRPSRHPQGALLPLDPSLCKPFHKSCPSPRCSHQPSYPCSFSELLWAQMTEGVCKRMSRASVMCCALIQISDMGAGVFYDCEHCLLLDAATGAAER